MRLIRLDIQNFISLERASLDFRPGIHYISGKNWDMGAEEDESNGAGKSSLFDAIQWCLFGTLSRGKGGADAVVNNIHGKDCRVMLAFEHEGKTYTILRTRKDTEFGNSTQFWIDGVPHTQHRTDDTKEEIADFLPITEDIFLHAVQVGQGMPDRFLDLSEPGKHDLICQIAHATVFDLAQAHAKDKEKAASLAARVLVGTLDSLRDQRTGLEGDLRIQEDALRMYRSQKAPNLDEARAVEVHLEGQVSKLEEEITALLGEIATIDAKIGEANGNAARGEKALAQATVEIQARKPDCDRRLTDLNALHGQLSRLIEDVTRAQNSPNQCILCQKIPTGFNPATDCQNLREYLTEKNAEYARLLEIYNARNEEYAPLQAALAQWQDYHTQVSASREESLKFVRATTSHTNQLRYQIEIKRTSQATFRKDREELSRRINHHAQEIAALEGKITNLQGLIDRINQDMLAKTEQKAESERIARHWAYWVTNIPNLRAAAISKLLIFVNERITYYMQVFSAGAMGVELYQKAYGQGSKIQVDLRTAGGTYVMSSGGERRRVDLAVFLALFDLLQVSSGVRFNVLVCDEIMDGLSPAGVKNFASLLRQKATEGMCILVVSHNPAVQNVCEFDSVSTVEKRRGCATLVTQETLAHV